MLDPKAATLLEAVADTLTNQVWPATTGGAQHATRVAANLCRIVAREIESPDDPAVRDQLRDLLGLPAAADASEIWSALDTALDAGGPDLGVAALPLVRAVVEHELAITKPSYLQASQ